ncbi:hypothetical protein [Novosphingobium sp. PC22D]|uniref:hypothetical protein n=1 Tax=Novosphingobium sp. PC22D TaxID=1962403 RepID=UPI001F0B5936|nr:hypothetical protein [Novosphingobium sp. PC22D]
MGRIPVRTAVERDKALRLYGKTFISRGEVYPRSRLSARRKPCSVHSLFKEYNHMRKIVLAAAATIGALTLAACSETTEDAAEVTASSAADDASAMMTDAADAMGDAAADASEAAADMGDAAADAGAEAADAAQDTADAAADAAADAEAEMKQ